MVDARNLSGLILCGGLSSRMGGGDKCLLPLGARPILDHVVARAASQLDRLAISANGDRARFARYDLPVLSDTVPGFAGPLAGILAGLSWATEVAGCEGLISMAGDTPLFPDDLMPRLADAAGDDRIAVAASNGRRHPVFALWPIALRDTLDRFLRAGDERRVTAFMDMHDVVEVEFPMTETSGRIVDPFFNINRPGDLEEAERMLVRQDT